MTSIRNYDPSDPLSIFTFSGQLLNRTLSEVLPVIDSEIDLNEVDQDGKGGLGVLVEKYFFGYEPNSDIRADFPEAGLELKVAPLKKQKKGRLAIKERLVCDMIDYCALVNEEFETSRFFRKSMLMLIVFYLYIKGCPKRDLKFIYSVLWAIKDKDLLIIKQDFLFIRDKVRKGLAHEISEGDTMYLGACRKGQKGQAPRIQPFSDIRANARAFTIKTSYLRTILDYVNTHGSNMTSNLSDSEMPGLSLVTDDDLKKDSLDNLILRKFQKYIGKDYKEISKELGLRVSKGEKSKYARIVNNILFKNVKNLDKIEEIKKSGLKVKTIRLQKNGQVRENMSFKNIDYSEFLEIKDWEDSEWYDIITTRYLFVIFREVEDSNWIDESRYVLDKMFFWTMPTSDYPIAKDFWTNIKENVLNDTLLDRGDKSHANKFWQRSDNRFFHVRPKAVVSSNVTVSPLSNMVVPKKAYWFNNTYLYKEIVRVYGSEWSKLFKK